MFYTHSQQLKIGDKLFCNNLFRTTAVWENNVPDIHIVKKLRQCFSFRFGFNVK